MAQGTAGKAKVQQDADGAYLNDTQTYFEVASQTRREALRWCLFTYLLAIYFKMYEPYVCFYFYSD